MKVKEYESKLGRIPSFEDLEDKFSWSDLRYNNKQIFYYTIYF